MFNLSDKTILLVDDDKDFCFLIKMMMKKTQANLLFAYNAEESFNLMEQRKEHPVDIVLLDIQMPLVSGYSVIEVFKKKYPEIPVLAVTAFGMTGEREKCLKSGFDEYLAKPFDEADLISRIERLLKPQQ